MSRRYKKGVRKRSSTNSPFRSGFERRVATVLGGLHIKFKYEHSTFKYKLKLPPNNISCGTCGGSEVYVYREYTPDFFIVPLRRNIILEAKGKFTSDDRKKMKAVVQQHPKKRFVMVFQRNNKLFKGAKQTYMEWCAANKIEAVMYKDLKEWLINENL